MLLVALLAPEWILAWAVRQALRASALATELEMAKPRHNNEQWEDGRTRSFRLSNRAYRGRCKDCKENGCPCDGFAAAKRVAKAEEGADRIF